jgi:hypothetical protein
MAVRELIDYMGKAMKTISDEEANDALSGLNALRNILTDELAKIEEILIAIKQSEALASQSHECALGQCQKVRTGLLSGMASIDETLGWVHACMETSYEETELDYMPSFLHVDFSVPS